MSTEPEVLTLRQPQFSLLRTERALTAHFALRSWRHWIQVTAAPIVISFLPPALHWRVLKVSPWGVGWGASWASATTPRGHGAWQLCLSSLASHRLHETSSPPISKLGQWPDWCLCQAREKSHTLCGGGLSPQGPFVQKHEPKWTPGAEHPVAQRSWV